jgi:hypothetical protein
MRHLALDLLDVVSVPVANLGEAALLDLVEPVRPVVVGPDDLLERRGATNERLSSPFVASPGRPGALF